MWRPSFGNSLITTSAVRRTPAESSSATPPPQRQGAQRHAFACHATPDCAVDAAASTSQHGSCRTSCAKPRLLRADSRLGPVTTSATRTHTRVTAVVAPWRGGAGRGLRRPGRGSLVFLSLHVRGSRPRRARGVVAAVAPWRGGKLGSLIFGLSLVPASRALRRRAPRRRPARPWGRRSRHGRASAWRAYLRDLCSHSSRSGTSRGTCSSAALAASCRSRRLGAASQVLMPPPRALHQRAPPSRARTSRATPLHINHLCCSRSTRSGGSGGTCSSAAPAVSYRPRRLGAASQVVLMPPPRALGGRHCCGREWW